MARKPAIWAIPLALVLLGLSAFAADTIPTTFTYRPDSPVQSVYLAGSFNNWNTTATPMADDDGDGVWQATLELAPGKYSYKFVVNGSQWVADPAAKYSEDDGYGGQNSVIYVGVEPPADAQPAAASIVTPAGGLSTGGWLESKIERTGSGSPNWLTEVYLKLNGAFRPELNLNAEIKLTQSIALDSIDDWRDPLPLPYDSLSINQLKLTIALADPLDLSLFYHGRTGNSHDFLEFFKSDDDEDKLWDRVGAELLFNLGGFASKVGLASLPGDHTLIYGTTQGSIGEKMTLGGIFTYDTSIVPTEIRPDGEDYVTNLAIYGTYKLNRNTTVRGEIIAQNGTAIVPMDPTATSTVTFVYPRERESTGTTAVYVTGEFTGWSTDPSVALPLTRQANGDWIGSIDLPGGQYEYKFIYWDSNGDLHWIGTGTGGGNYKRFAGATGFQTFYFTMPGAVGEEQHVYIRGAWDWGKDYELVWDPVTGNYMTSIYMAAGEYEYIYHIDQSTWYGKGDTNLKKAVGSEKNYSALAYLAEVEYAVDGSGVKIGLKGAQPEFQALRYGLLGGNFNTAYIDGWWKASDKWKLTFYASYTTDGDFKAGGAPYIVKPGFDSTNLFPGLEYFKGHYETDLEDKQTVYLEAKYRPLLLKVTYKVNDPENDSLDTLKVEAESDLPLDFRGKVGYFAKLDGDYDNTYLELAKKLSLCDEATLSLAYNTSDEKWTFKYTMDF